MEIEVIGIGAVGIVTAVGLAELGHKVSAVDIDSEKLNKISTKVDHIGGTRNIDGITTLEILSNALFFDGKL